MHPRPVVKPLLWLAVLFLLGVAVTCAVFAVCVAHADRGTTFYVALSLVCAAELVLFANLADARLARAGMPAAGMATRLQVHVLVVFWLVATIIVAAMIASPDRADTVGADRILVTYLVLTLLFFGAAYFIYTKDLEIQRVDQRLETQRRSLHLLVPDVEAAIRAAEQLGAEHPPHAVLADRIRKQLDAVRADLEAAVVSERSVERDNWEPQQYAERLEKQSHVLATIARNAVSASADEVLEILQRLGQQAGEMRTTLGQRERALVR